MALKLAVVGSINIDQTVVADRIPNKGETLPGQPEVYSGRKRCEPGCCHVKAGRRRYHVRLRRG